MIYLGVCALMGDLEIIWWGSFCSRLRLPRNTTENIRAPEEGFRSRSGGPAAVRLYELPAGRGSLDSKTSLNFGSAVMRWQMQGLMEHSPPFEGS
jgi:hypothetical protein